MRPVSNRTRSTDGPFAKAAAIVLGAVGVLASRMILPSRSTTQTCVSSIETSNPAKYSMAVSSSHRKADLIDFRESSRPLPDVEKFDFLNDDRRHGRGIVCGRFPSTQHLRRCRGSRQPCHNHGDVGPLSNPTLAARGAWVWMKACISACNFDPLRYEVRSAPLRPDRIRLRF